MRPFPGLALVVLLAGSSSAQWSVVEFQALEQGLVPGYGYQGFGPGIAIDGNRALVSTSASGFAVSAAGVEGAKDGLFFFGTHGQQANPWGNGTSYPCVVPPVKRTGLLAGAGRPVPATASSRAT